MTYDLDRPSKADLTLWRNFIVWCEQNHFAPLPAEPSTIASYISLFVPPRLREPLPQQSLIITDLLHSIRSAHLRAGFDSPRSMQDPVLAEAWKHLRWTLGPSETPKNILTEDLVVRLVVGLDLSIESARDKALLLVGFAGALSRFELAAMQFEHLTWSNNAVHLTIPPSESKQMGQGTELWIRSGADKATCPVLALQDWLAASRIRSGPVFRRIDRLGKIGVDITPDIIGRIIKRLAWRAGLEYPEGYGALRLRTDFASGNNFDGTNGTQIAVQTRHQRAPMADDKRREGGKDFAPQKGQLEALLMAAGRPMTLKALARGLAIDEQEVDLLLQQYESDLQSRNKAIFIRRRANGIRMEVKSEHVWAIERAIPQHSPMNVTDEELEVLAVIAITQPVKAADIDAICKRETARDLETLRDRSLVSPRAVPDPLQKDCWKPTQLFLDMFDLETVHSLHALVRSGNHDLPLAQVIEDSFIQLRQLGLSNRIVRAVARKQVEKSIVPRIAQR